MALAPIADGPLPLVTQRVTAPTVTTGQPPRPTPVVLEAQRGLRTEIAPWLTKQLELDLQVLTDCRPPIDGEAERTERITKRFEEAYAAAVEARAGTEKVASDTTGDAQAPEPSTDSDASVGETPTPDTTQELTALGDEEWERVAEEAARA